MYNQKDTLILKDTRSLGCNSSSFIFGPQISQRSNTLWLVSVALRGTGFHENMGVCVIQTHPSPNDSDSLLPPALDRELLKHQFVYIL